MFELAGVALDLHDDSGEEVLTKHADRLVEVAGEVKLAGPDRLARLEDKEFALIFMTSDGKKHRKYAMHDVAHTAVSSAFFEENAHKLPEVCQQFAAWQLYKAAARFKIPATPFLANTEKDVETPHPHLFHTHDLEPPESPKEASAPEDAFIPDSEFLLVEKSESGTVREFRVSTYPQCKEALGSFEETYIQLTPPQRRKVATALMQKAEDFGLAVKGKMLSKYAAEEYNPHCRAHMSLRMHMLSHDTDIADVIRERLIPKIGSVPASEFAEEVREFDEATKLDELWGAGILDPYLSVLGGGEPPSVKVGDLEVPEDRVLLALSQEEKLGGMFGQDLLGRFREDPVGTFKTMPPTVQSDIMRLVP